MMGSPEDDDDDDDDEQPAPLGHAAAAARGARLQLGRAGAGAGAGAGAAAAAGAAGAAAAGPAGAPPAPRNAAARQVEDGGSEDDEPQAAPPSPADAELHAIMQAVIAEEEEAAGALCADGFGSMLVHCLHLLPSAVWSGHDEAAGPSAAPKRASAHARAARELLDKAEPVAKSRNSTPAQQQQCLDGDLKVSRAHRGSLAGHACPARAR